MLDSMFADQTMYDRLLEIARSEGFEETLRVLPYAKEKHEGQFRRTAKNGTRIPYILHPVMMALHAYDLGVHDDALLATAILHDVCEDCFVAPENLPCSKSIQYSVDLLTRRNYLYVTREASYEDYYNGIRTDANASLVKGLDRCNNVSMMAQCFDDEKIRQYIDETKNYVIPILDHMRVNWPQYEKAGAVLRYHMESVMDTVLEMMERS